MIKTRALMKISFLHFVLFICIKGYTQDNIKLIPIGGGYPPKYYRAPAVIFPIKEVAKYEWQIAEYPINCNDCICLKKIKLGGEVLIDTKTYRPIYIFTNDTIKCIQKKGVQEFGYLRETKDKKIFWCDWLDEEHIWKEYKVFDFNLDLNDSIGEFIVYKIDSIKIQNQFRKRLIFKNAVCQDIEWIDGVWNMLLILNKSNYFDKSDKNKRTACSYFKQLCLIKDDFYIYGDSMQIKNENIKRRNNNR